MEGRVHDDRVVACLDRLGERSRQKNAVVDGA